MYSLKRSYSLTEHIKWGIDYVNGMIRESDRKYTDQLWMDRNTFFTLCGMLKAIGKLDDSKYTPLEKQVSIFFNNLVHHTKN